MDENLLAFWAVTCALPLPIGLAAYVIVTLIKSRHAERMSMIAQGTILKEPEKPSNRYPALRNGMLMVGLAIGFMVGMCLPSTVYDDFSINWFVPVCTVLFGGFGFIAYFFVARYLLKKEQGNGGDRKIND